MADIIQLRRDSASAWTAADPVLADGEFGVESDTGNLKLGDGESAWSALPYFSGGAVWGGISGTLANQSDLQSALAGMLSDAPIDGSTYGRKDGAWAPVTGGGGGSGDVNGPSSSIDNTLPRFDGAGGKTLQGSGVLVDDSDAISGYKGAVNRQTGTAYTLASADSGKIVELANAATITLTLPNNLPAGFCCTIVQDAAGQVTLAAASGATIKNRQSHTKLAGNGAFGTLYVSSNAGTAAAYRFAGDTAA